MVTCWLENQSFTGHYFPCRKNQFLRTWYRVAFICSTFLSKSLQESSTIFDCNLVWGYLPNPSEIEYPVLMSIRTWWVAKPTGFSSQRDRVDVTVASHTSLSKPCLTISRHKALGWLDPLLWVLLFLNTDNCCQLFIVHSWLRRQWTMNHEPWTKISRYVSTLKWTGMTTWSYHFL